MPPNALVIDDHELVRMNAANILEEAGFRTLEAANRDAAVVILNAHHACITLLFTDVEMPGSLNGLR